MVIIETEVFSGRIRELLDDEEHAALQSALCNRPNMGVLIQGTGGLRKVRWRTEGGGKREGIRVIYYWMNRNEQIYMLYVYAKHEQDDLSIAQKRLLRQIVERWTDE